MITFLFAAALQSLIRQHRVVETNMSKIGSEDARNILQGRNIHDRRVFPPAKNDFGIVPRHITFDSGPWAGEVLATPGLIACVRRAVLDGAAPAIHNRLVSVHDVTATTVKVDLDNTTYVVAGRPDAVFLARDVAETIMPLSNWCVGQAGCHCPGYERSSATMTQASLQECPVTHSLRMYLTYLRSALAFEFKTTAAFANKMKVATQAMLEALSLKDLAGCDAHVGPAVVATDWATGVRVWQVVGNTMCWYHDHDDLPLPVGVALIRKLLAHPDTDPLRARARHGRSPLGRGARRSSRGPSRTDDDVGADGEDSGSGNIESTSRRSTLRSDALPSAAAHKSHACDTKGSPRRTRPGYKEATATLDCKVSPDSETTLEDVPPQTAVDQNVDVFLDHLASYDAHFRSAHAALVERGGVPHELVHLLD